MPSRSHVSPALIGIILALGFALVLGGVAVGHQWASRSSAIPRDGAPISKPSAAPLPATAPLPTPAAPAAPAGEFSVEFASFASQFDAQVGLVVGAVGPESATVVSGDWGSGTAWSTIKVPLAIASLRATNSREVTEAMRAAITRSDNAAAEQMWQDLGDPSAAAHKVEDILREYDDPTVVESQKVRPEYTAFGQTQWSLGNQAAFLASAICDARNAPIFFLMSQVEPSQRWGLGIIDGAQFKGGWGPSPAGDYLVRQMGIIPGQSGSTVVLAAAAPTSGSFVEGQEIMTQIAGWLSDHADLLPTGRCP